MTRHIKRTLQLAYSITRVSSAHNRIPSTFFINKRLYSSTENTELTKNPSININSTELTSLCVHQSSPANEVLILPNSDDIMDDNLCDNNSSIYDITNKIKLPKALDICDEDVSYIAPYLSPTFNFAAYADKSPMIQELVKLGVYLWKIEETPAIAEALLQRNFEDIKPYIQFLYDVGIEADNIGEIITMNPKLITEDLDDLHTRIRYLRAHQFTRDNIARIVNKNPAWLSQQTVDVDRRLGYFQTQFKMSGSQVRFLVVKQPKLITYPFDKIREHTFAVEAQMGFDIEEIKGIILKRPRILMTERKITEAAFDYAHNVMQLSHEILAQLPTILLVRTERLKNRHEYLQLLKRVQYDPTKPLYISPDDIAMGTDYLFCTNVAKTSVELYNMFLKSR